MEIQTDFSKPMFGIERCGCGFELHYTSCVSGPREKTIKCPICGKENQITLAKGVNEKYLEATIKDQEK